MTKAKRGYAEASALELIRESPDRLPPRCDHGGEPCPGAPWQSLPYEQQLRHKRSQVEDALVRLGGLDGFELEPIEPAVEQWRYRNKLEYSFGERDGELVLGFHARGRWDLIVDAEDCQLASERNNETRNEIRGWARGGGPACLRPPRRHRGPPQPRRSRGPPDRTAADPPRHLTRRDPAPARRPAHDRRGLERRHRRPDRRARRGAPRGGALRPALPDLPQRLLPDQHGDGGAPLRDRRRDGGSHRRRARLRPLLRDRHPGPQPRVAGRAKSGASRSSRRRSRTPRRTPGSTGSRTPSSGPGTRARRSGRCWRRPGSRTSWSSTRRARASPRRWCGA